MGTTRHILRRPRRGELSFTQMEEMWLGPSHRGSAFVSDDHRKAMWVRHRDKIMRLWAQGGKRPYCWWRYEAPEIEGLGKSGRKPHEHEKSILFDFAPQVLGAEEKLELEREWRRQFDKSWEPSFSYLHEGRVLTGQIARERYWIWADLPMTLHDLWVKERRRCGRTIKELEKASGAPEPADTVVLEDSLEAEDGDDPGAAA